jgi:hypothetical protein
MLLKAGLLFLTRLTCSMVNEITLLNVSFADPRINLCNQRRGPSCPKIGKKTRGLRNRFRHAVGKYSMDTFVKLGESGEITLRRVKDSIKGLGLVIEPYQETLSRVSSVATVQSATIAATTLEPIILGPR